MIHCTLCTLPGLARTSEGQLGRIIVWQMQDEQGEYAICDTCAHELGLMKWEDKLILPPDQARAAWAYRTYRADLTRWDAKKVRG